MEKLSREGQGRGWRGEMEAGGRAFKEEQFEHNCQENWTTKGDQRKRLSTCVTRVRGWFILPKGWQGRTGSIQGGGRVPAPVKAASSSGAAGCRSSCLSASVSLRNRR